MEGATPPSGTAGDANLPILIIGSGSTGLALAQGLRKAGIACTVFEKNDSHHRERDWNMGLHWGAPVLKSLIPEEWWRRIQSVQVDPHVPTKEQDTLNWLRGDTGETMAAFTFGPFYRLRRSKLRDLLSQGLNIEYDKHLESISYAQDHQAVTAHFADGTAATGSMLVGADGARSSTRQVLLGPDMGAINRIPYAATFVQQKFTKEQALYLRKFHPLFLACAHPSNNFAFFGMHDAADPDDPSSWTFFFYISWKSSLEEQEATKDWTDAQRLAQQKELAKAFCDPWKSAYEWTPDDASVWYLGLTDWDPGRPGHRWDNYHGLVTMVGDAVHPMTYQRGQGLNHSVTDAGKLRDALIKIEEGGDRQRLVSGFEDEMIQRGGLEVRDGTANTMLLHDWEKVKQSPLFTKGMKKSET
ncbi:FAD/NAD(P)-binding domain-containing protein [Cucurbitaria berberidis CBS 394.84]|uniref:FAD/NAD(P)-binding domain-containing protein n=1 Tax=Cucurbitaria berberidis CBS 394.84 TaxID=1168544 RepID=A0A9P4GCT1_9PLEO|nr:FAD/NAD(P)-binding domain-containing protein [Cucurbitaria berberidis CBS 394.84]KAF1842830.1 FAD/NAD(P)-binding domain-containing protein [Cucurbitaria berberidis CBS 394.84]